MWGLLLYILLSLLCSCDLTFSTHLEFESSLVRALGACFCSPEGTPVAVLRFWTLLSIKLITNLSILIFPKLSKTYQV